MTTEPEAESRKVKGTSRLTSPEKPFPFPLLLSKFLPTRAPIWQQQSSKNDSFLPSCFLGRKTCPKKSAGGKEGSVFSTLVRASCCQIRGLAGGGGGRERGDEIEVCTAAQRAPIKCCPPKTREEGPSLPKQMQHIKIRRNGNGGFC